ncbi:MAG: hypothetical protein WAW06_11110 [bacterium]
MRRVRETLAFDLTVNGAIAVIGVGSLVGAAVVVAATIATLMAV